jgi:hypothetical protein
MMHPTLRRARPGVAAVALAVLAACASGGGVESSRHPAEPPIDFAPPVSPAIIALDHAAELGLTDAQRASLTAIRRGLDSANAPLRLRLDSLRPTQRPVNPRDLSQEQRESIRTRRTAVGAVMAEWSAHNAEVRPRVLAVLTPEQQQRVVVLEEEVRKRDQERQENDRLMEERRARYGRP